MQTEIADSSRNKLLAQQGMFPAAADGFCQNQAASYYRARYYDALAGRFVSEDPIGFAGSGPNFYAYVENDPANHRDPFGLCQANNSAPPPCILYFFKQVYNHANPFSPDISTAAGEGVGYSYSAVQYNKYLQFVSAKYSNVFRTRVLGRATQAIGRGAIVGALTTLVVAEGEALVDEIRAFQAGECQ
jgi:RHS repeat-associated protein